MTAIKKGKIAPPTMPVNKIPVKVPWFLLTEFRPKEIIRDQIPEIEKPNNLNDNKDNSSFPKRANRINIDEHSEKILSKIFPSIIFIKIRVAIVPKVKLPQKADITSVPTTFGSKLWYWYRNCDTQLFIPCSTPT